MLLRLILIAGLSSIIVSCAVGPDYVKPTMQLPDNYKELAKNWKVAAPQDDCLRGDWWKIFNDPQLNALEDQLNTSNQTIATAEANYRQANALVDQARANYYPTLSTTAEITRQKQGSMGISNSTNIGVNTGSSGGSVTTTHSLAFNASWEPDIWGAVRRSVEANNASAQASAALLALTKLSAQASLAQSYFQLRALDSDQKLLDETVVSYQNTLSITKNQYKSGIAAQVDVLQAQSQMESARALALNNKITRSQMEHAIAILIGKMPEDFSLQKNPLRTQSPMVPISVPTLLLERRPDIAQAERLMAQANAQIGVAKAAYFPSLTLSGYGSYQNTGYAKWFSLPGMAWGLGPQLAETILDGGLRKATVAAARAGYDSSVASYKQIVLAAFQDVENNLVSVRVLKDKTRVQQQAARDAKRALQMKMNQYKAGAAAYTDVLTAQIAAYTAEKNAIDSAGLQMTSAVGLVKALGGGWE